MKHSKHPCRRPFGSAYTRITHGRFGRCRALIARRPRYRSRKHPKEFGALIETQTVTDPRFNHALRDNPVRQARQQRAIIA